MNKIYKKIWNKSRGAFVAVSEAMTSASQSSGKATAGVVIGSMLMVAPSAFAEITPDSWSGEVDHTATIDFAMDAQGYDYGHIYSGSWESDPTHKALIKITETGSFTGGVYGVIEDVGSQGYLNGSGRFRHYALDNAGQFVDSKDLPAGFDYPDVTKQLGTTSWIDKFVNRATGTVDVYDIRSQELKNESANFKVEALHIKDGGQLENTGTMVVSDLRVGISDAGVFNSYQVSTTEDGNDLSLPTVSYNEDGTTSFINDGTVNAGTAHVAGIFKNNGTLTTTKADGAASSFGTTTNAGTITLAADASFKSLAQDKDGVSVSGTNITVAENLNNAKGSVTASEKLVLNGLMNNASELSGKSVEINAPKSGTDQNVNAGNITATEGVKVAGDFNNTGTLATGTGLTVSNNATAELDGTVTGDELALYNGTATIKSAQVALKKLKSTGTSVLNNDQELTFDNVVADGMTYNQTAGSLSTADNSFFANSELNISGGKLTRTAEGGNTLGSGNTVKMSGATASSYVDQQKLAANWQDNQTVVHVGQLNSDSTVDVGTGSVLHADEVALTGNSLNVNGGALMTSLSDLFETVGEDAFTIDEGELTALDTSVLAAKDVTDFKDGILDQITIDENGINLVVSDDYVSEKALESASAKLQEAAAGKTSNVAYVGDKNSASENGNAFYHGTYERLKAEQADDSAFKVPGLVFGMVYENREDAESADMAKLVVGEVGTEADTHYVDQSIGFVKVNGTDDVTVQDGKTFVLTGTAEGGELLATNAGTLSVKGEGSRFLFGNKGVTDATGNLGNLAVEEGGEFAIVIGKYTVGTAILNNGTGNVVAGTELTVGTYSDQADGSLNNAGTLAMDTAENFNGLVTNAGTLTVGGTATNVNNTFANNGGVATFEQLNIKAGGLTNAETAKLIANNGFSVDAALTGSEVTSAGRLVSYGDNTVSGKLTLEATSNVVAQGNTIVAGSAGKILSSGKGIYGDLTVNDSANVTLKEGGLIAVEGTLANDEMSTVVLGKGTTLVAGKMNNGGRLSLGKNVSLSIGARYLTGFMESEEATAIKGDDYREAPATLSISRAPMLMALSDEKVWGTPISTEEHDGRHYELDQDPTNLPPVGTRDGGFAGFGGAAYSDSIGLASGNFINGVEVDFSDNVYILAGSTLNFASDVNLTAQDYQLHGEWWETNVINRGTMNMEGSSKFTNLILSENGLFHLKGTGTDNSETLNILNGGKYQIDEGGQAQYQTLKAENGGQFENNGMFGVGTATLADGSQFVNNNAFTADTSITIGGSFTGTGTLTAPTATVEATGTLNQAKFEGTDLINKGATTLASVANFGADQTYTHFGPDASIEIGDNTWFNGTNLVFDGGANVTKDDLKYSEGTLGANTVTIQGEVGPTITMGTPNTGTFDGMTTVHVAKLTDETNASVLEGGRLIVDELTGNANALLNGGVLDIQLTDISTPADMNQGLLIGAGSASDTAKVESDVLGNKVTMAFADEKLGGINLQNGTVALTSDKVNSLKNINAIAQGLAGKGTITTVYNGALEGERESGALDLATVADLFAEQAGKGGTEVNNPGVVLTQYDLLADDGSHVKFTTDATADNAINGSIGFATIRGANNVTVSDGLTASLTGTVMTDPENFDWSDDNRLLKNPDAGIGGTVTTEAGGTMDFGSHGTPDKNSGWIDKLVNDGVSTVKNFVLGVKEMITGNGGNAEVASNGKIIVNKFEVAEGGKFSNKGETVLGTDDADEVVNLAGELSNEEKLDATKVETVNVTGTANNNGNAGYNDMTIAAGGTSTNSGTEKGHNLSVEGIHSNSGTSIWDTTYAVAEGGKAENSGKLDAGEGFVVAGDFTNKGANSVLDASKTPTTNVTGSITNEGKADYQDMVIAENASSVNSGTEQGKDLTVQGTHNNTGTSIWNSYAVEEAAKGENAGKLDVGTGFDVAGDFTNKGADAVLDATKVPTTNITGTITNEGKANYKDMVVADGASSTNSGTEQGNYLTVAGTHTNTGTSIWKNGLEVQPDATATNEGKLDVDNAFVIAGNYENKPSGEIDATGVPTTEVKGSLVNDGKANYADMNIDKDGKSDNNGYEKGNNLTVGGTHTNTGTSIWNQITTDGGKLVVNGGKTEAGTADVKPGSTIEVPKGVLAVNGMTADEADKASDKDAVLGMGGSLDVTGSTVIIGTVDPADTVGDGDVYFGKDSALVIDTTKLTGDKGISGDGKVTVKDGSNLVVSNASWGKHILVTNGLETEDDGVSWRGDNLVNLTDKDLEVTVLEEGYLLSAGNEKGTDIGALDDRYLVPDTINGLIDTEEGAKIRDVNSEHPDVMIIDRMLDKKFVGENAEGGLDVEKSLLMLNSVTGFNGATGFDAYANAQNFENMSSVEDHLSDWDSKHERTLWVDAIGSASRIDKLSLEGANSGYKADTYGFILGADAPLANKNAVLGAAFAYSRGDLKSRGDFLANKTDVDSYAFSIYGAYDINGKATVSGQIGYGWSKGDASMNFSDIQGNGYHVTGDTKAKTFFVGVRADKKFEVKDGVSVVPHIGVRLAHTSYDGYDTKINGKAAFHNKADSTTFVQMPIGVAVKGDVKKNGWNIAPKADLSIVPQFGNRNNSTKVSAKNFAGVDDYSYEVAGSVVGKLGLGVSAQKKNHSVGINYTGAVGNKGAQSHGLMLKYKYSF